MGDYLVALRRSFEAPLRIVYCMTAVTLLA